MKNWKFSIALIVCVLYAAAGITVGCVDLRDHWTVEPTEVPGSVGATVVPSDKPLPINDAKREVEVIKDDTNRWIEWRNKDIAKEEQRVALIEGSVSSGLTVFGEEVAKYAGPFAPLLTLGIGYLTKRRNDRTPDEVRKEKEDSYNAGVEFGKALAEAVVESTKKDENDRPNGSGTT